MAEHYPPTFPIKNNELAGVIVRTTTNFKHTLMDRPLNTLCLQVVNVVAVLSTVALLSIILRLAWLCILRVTRRKNITQSREYVFFNTQLGYYAACLLIANMFNSAAGLMGLPFLLARRITEGMIPSSLFIRILTLFCQKAVFAPLKVAAIPRS